MPANVLFIALVQLNMDIIQQCSTYLAVSLAGSGLAALLLNSILQLLNVLVLYAICLYFINTKQLFLLRLWKF